MYRKYVKIVLKYLKNINLFLDITKYKFHITKILYLRFIISTYNIKMDPAKIKTIFK